MNKNIKNFIGIIAILLILSGVYASTKRNDDKMMQDGDVNNIGQNSQMIKDVDLENNDVMMKKEDGAVMVKDDTSMKSGSYELYTPEKVMLASDSHDVVLFFRAGWCPSCRTLDLDIKKNMSSIPSSLAILDVDYDNSTALKQKYGVTYQHTLVQVDKDGNLIKKWSGGSSLAGLINEVK